MEIQICAVLLDSHKRVPLYFVEFKEELKYLYIKRYSAYSIEIKSTNFGDQLNYSYNYRKDLFSNLENKKILLK